MSFSEKLTIALDTRDEVFQSSLLQWQSNLKPIKSTRDGLGGGQERTPLPSGIRLFHQPKGLTLVARAEKR